MKSLKEQVEAILKETPSSRNSDHELLVRIWKKFHHTRYMRLRGGVENDGQFLALLRELPSHESVKRWRAKYNSEGDYLPTDKRVLKQRGLLEDKKREELGYPTHGELADQAYGARKLSKQSKLF